ncbi:MAG: DUF1700 domain-containing protein [Sphingomonadales bacterium]|nr:DUF1700 domain-containing protein [Sphingomonadales bacterium]
MTRDQFLNRLERGLSGMPQSAVEDILADYRAHFAAAEAEGRSADEVAMALGDPARLARELRLEAGVRQWQEVRSPSAALGAVIGVLGLGALDILVLAPILLPVLGVIFGLYVMLLGLFVAGGAVLIAGPFAGFPGGALTAVFAGLGLMAAAIAFAALLSIVTMALVNALIWFGRLHYQLLKPAIEPAASQGALS